MKQLFCVNCVFLERKHNSYRCAYNNKTTRHERSNQGSCGRDAIHYVEKMKRE